MKKAILAYPNNVNLGDEIQSIAAKRLLGNIDLTIDRESLHTFEHDSYVKLLCNGWFMSNPSHWPPSEYIKPLFVSMHISKANSSFIKMFNDRAITYFKKHQPIGCRDKSTLELFKKYDIDAYFSNDLTLTLENNYAEPRNEKILLVDVFRTNYDYYFRDFHEKNMVPKKYREDVEIVRHRTNYGLTEEERFEKAENLLKKYATAKLVITSRIHCAIPCMAFRTPFYFVKAGYHNRAEGLDDRFDGLLEMFETIFEDSLQFGKNTVKHKIGRYLRLYKLLSTKPLDINWDNPNPNNYDFSYYKSLLKEKVNNFFNT